MQKAVAACTGEGGGGGGGGACMCVCCTASPRTVQPTKRINMFRRWDVREGASFSVDYPDAAS